MEFKPDQVLEKTPQGVNATRSGEGLSSKSHAVLKLFDGTKPVGALKQACLGAYLSEAEFSAALMELQQFDYLRVLDVTAEAQIRAVADAQRRMLTTLDFTAADVALAEKAAAAENPAGNAAPSAVPTATLPMMARMEIVDGARDEKGPATKLESEVRQKLMAELQPRVEAELRAGLRPRMEEELRPKVIAALRPGLEGEVRAALAKELAPRVELELKARFAKMLAAQKTAADQQAAKSEPAAASVVGAFVVDSLAERVLASVNVPVFSLDNEGVCSYMSPAWEKFSGFAMGETVGKPFAEFFAEADRRAMGVWLKESASGAALRLEHHGTLARHDHDPLWVELRVAPLYSAGGDSMGVCGTIRDATEDRRIAEQAEADGVRLLLLVEQIDTGVVLEDGNGNIQQVNPALCKLLSLDAAPHSLEGMAVAGLLERISREFIAPEGFLRRVTEMRDAGEDSKGASFVMVDGRVIEQDYLAVGVDDRTVGRLWLYREVPRVQSGTSL